MHKNYKKVKVLDSPTEEVFVYLVESPEKVQMYMYELPANDPLEQQFKFMEKLSAQHVLKIYGRSQTQQGIFYIVECPTPSLLKHQSLLPQRFFQEQEAKNVISQIFAAVHEIHSLSYLFLNTCLDTIKYADGHAKLTSFFNLLKISKVDKVHQNLTQIIGERYLPPEGFQNKPLSIKSDYWMIGIVYFFMLHGEYPFVGQKVYDSIRKKCQDGYDYRQHAGNLKNSKAITPGNCDFFHKVFTIDPEKRISQCQMKIFANMGPYFNEQCLSLIKQQKVEESIVGSCLNSNVFHKHLKQQMLIIQFLDKNAGYARTETEKILEEPQRIALRYGLLKLALVKCQEMLLLIDSKEAQPYRLNKETVLAKEHVHKLVKILEMQWKQMLQELAVDCQTSNSCRNFLQDLYTTDIPNNYVDLKRPLRKLTARLFTLQSHLHRKAKDHNESHRRLQLLARLVIFHLINRLFQEQEVDHNLKLYYRWNNSSKDCQNLHSWLKQEEGDKLTKFIKTMSEKYL